MYMSKEMLDYQKEDDRYRYCLKRLDEMQHRQVTYEIIERPELTKVHEFDYFYQDFRSIISSLYKTMDDFIIEHFFRNTGNEKRLVSFADAGRISC